MTEPSTLLADVRRELDVLGATSRLRALHTTTPLAGPHIDVGGRRMLDLSSNDYLGLASDPAALAAFQARPGGAPELAREAGGATASRLLSGNRSVCCELEAALSHAYGRPALVFNSGYHANIGVLPALAGREDLVLSDRLCHASLVDGVRLAGARRLRYRHGDLDHLGSLLRNKRGEARRVFIVSESVFSMDGDCVDVAALVDLKERFDAVLVLDEAHAVGVRGRHGLGAAETAGVLDRVDILVGTLGKAYGSLGAFVVAAKEICSYLVNRARPFIFSTGLPPNVHVWSLATYARAATADDERMHLAALAERFRESLKTAGLRTYGSSQIVPVILGTDAAAVDAAAALQAAGYWVLPIRPPTVPPHTARLRFSLCANMMWDDIAGVVPVLKNVVSA